MAKKKSAKGAKIQSIGVVEDTPQGTVPVVETVAIDPTKNVAGRGKKQCPECSNYIGAKSKVCPICSFVQPPSKNAAAKAAASPATVRPSPATNGKTPSSGNVMQAVRGAGDLIKETGSIDSAIEFLQIWKQGQNQGL